MLLSYSKCGTLRPSHLQIFRTTFVDFFAFSVLQIVMSQLKSSELAPPEIWFLIDDFIDNANDWLAFGQTIAVIRTRHQNDVVQGRAKDRFTRRRHLYFRPIDSTHSQLPAFVRQLVEHQDCGTQYCLPNGQLHGTCEMAQVTYSVWWDVHHMYRTIIYASPEDADTFDCALVVMTTLGGNVCEKILLAAFQSKESWQAFLDGHLNRWDRHLSEILRVSNMSFVTGEYKHVVDGHELYLCRHFAINTHFCDFVDPDVHNHHGPCVGIGANLDSYRLTKMVVSCIDFKK